jgi:glycosyltransferase involved in cell wall biosynthesis
MRPTSETRRPVSVVLAAYNEEQTVAGTVEAFTAALSAAGLPAWEILLVDDGSTDGTREAAERAGARVVCHPQNAGYGRTIKDGIAAAEHDTIVICDADGTYPAGRVPALLDTYFRGFDMVVGQRTSFGDGWFKTIMRHVLKWLVQYSAGQSIPDINSGLRIFDRRVVTPLFPTLCNTFSFTTSLTLAYLMTGRFVAYVPISYGQRSGSTKVHLFRDALRTLQYIVEALVHYNPLKVFLLVAATCVVAALAALATWAWRGSPAALVLSATGFATALVAFCFGLVAVRLRLSRDD